MAGRQRNQIKLLMENASLIYRLPGTSQGRFRRIADIPDAPRLIQTQGVASLHESGWLEDAMFFSDDDGMEEAA
jgi:hypothetical protein